MKRQMKLFCIMTAAFICLSGCSNKQNGDQGLDPMTSVYLEIENMNYEMALNVLAEIEPNRKNRQEIMRVTGICYMGMGQYKEAAEALETALSYNGGFIKEADYDINQYLAVAYNSLGRYEDAEHVYSAIAALRPKDAEAHYAHGVTLLEMGEYEESKKAFDKAVTLEPDNYDRIILIYKAFYKFGYGSLGLEYVDAAMQNQTNMNDYDKGRMLYHIGKYNEAVSALEKVDKKKYEDASMYLGMSYEAMGDYNYAASVYTSGVEDSTNPVLFNQLGLCQMKRGAYEDALTAFQKGLQCEDTSLQQMLRYNEAIAYEYLAEFDIAKKMLADYLKDYPNDQEAQREYQFLKTR